MKKYQDRISDALAASGTTLMQSQDISTLLAAKILGETAGVSRFPPSPTSRAMREYRRWMPRAAKTNANGSTPAATDNSTPSSTSWPSARSSTAVRAVTTTPGKSAKANPLARPDGHSSAGSATSSIG
jgi:hypothetical protein